MNEIKPRLWIPLAFCVGASVGIAGAYLILKNPPMPGASIQQIPLPTSTIQTPPAMTEIPVNTSTGMNGSDIGATTSTSTDEVEKIEIVWTKPKQVDMSAKYKQDQDLSQQSGYRPTKIGFDLGYVKQGKYAGMRLIKWQWMGDGLGEQREDLNTLISTDGKQILVSRTFDFYQDENGRSQLMSQYGLKVVSFEYQDVQIPPKVLTLENGKMLRIKTVYAYSTNFSCTKGSCSLTPLGTTKEGYKYYASSDDIVGFFAGKNGCVVVYTDDGRAYYYNTLPEEFTMISDQGESYGDVFSASKIAWDKDLGVGKASYNSVEHNGCGNTGCAALVEAALVTSAGGVERVGTLGDTVLYRPINPTQHPVVKEAFDQWYVAEGEKSMEDFMKKFPVPVLFAKDNLGRWFKVIHIEVVPAAECGKPVIYLYPEQKTSVTVKLPRFVNVTVSEPTYPQNGWNVIANPNGRLEYADGKTYNSLYWEGTGITYQTPRTGWVVKGSEVESFLDRVLPQYGLNAQEAKDFKEFWLPHMQKHDQMRVSFLTEDWSKAAPLAVSPRPKTDIRIFMDWTPVSGSPKIEAPVIKTPARDGFTLVEWGGTLYR